MYRRLLLAGVSLAALNAGAQGAQFYWTGAQDNLWSNHNNWGSAFVPGASDGAHLLDPYGSLGNNEELQLTAGQTTVGSLFVEHNFYELTDDGVGFVLHELIVSNTISVDEGVEFVVSGLAGLTAQGSIDLGETGYSLTFTDLAFLTLDGATLDSGGIRFTDSSTLEIAQTGATVGGISGGKQEFFDESQLLAGEADSITGGVQLFYYNSVLDAGVSEAVTGGWQGFNDQSELYASALNSVAGGRQVFSGTSKLLPMVAGSVGDTTIELRGSSVIDSQVANGLSDTTDIVFSEAEGGTGGTFDLNGFDQVVGTINSTNMQGSIGGSAGIITGGAVLTVAGDGDSYFGGVIEGGFGDPMALTKEGGGTLTLAGTSTYWGPTNVNEGGLVVNGDIHTSVLTTVGADGWLGGVGTVGNTRVESGGELRPGNGIGTLHVDGDFLELEDGSTYVVEIEGVGTGATAGHTDLVESSKLFQADMADLRIENQGGVYSAGSVYTIAHANAGAIGSFDQIINDDITPFLRFELGQDANSFFLTVARSATLASAAETPNQEAVAGAVDGLPDGNPIFDAVASLGEDDALAALDALSGEIHASLKGGLIEDSRFVREASLGRLDGATGEGTAPWFQPYGAYGDWQGDGNAADMTRDAFGMFAGLEGEVGGLRLGGLVGYGQSAFVVGDRASSADASTYHAGIYAGTAEGPLRLRGGLAYGLSDVTTRRDMVIGPPIDETLDADYTAGTAQAFGEVGYDIEVGSATFEPFAGLTFVSTSVDGFTESGGDAALSAEGQDTQQTYATLGLRASGEFQVGKMAAKAHGSLAWRHAFGDIAQSAALTLEGQEFTIAGVPTALDAALIGFGLDLGLSDSATLGVSYSGVITESSADQSVKGELSVRF